MGERSGDLAGHCNTLTLWMRKLFWVCLAVCGRALSCRKIPNVMLLQIRYNNRFDNSVTSAECHLKDGPLSIERRVAYSLRFIPSLPNPISPIPISPEFSRFAHSFFTLSNFALFPFRPISVLPFCRFAQFHFHPFFISPRSHFAQ